METDWLSVARAVFIAGLAANGRLRPGGDLDVGHRTSDCVAATESLVAAFGGRSANALQHLPVAKCVRQSLDRLLTALEEAGSRFDDQSVAELQVAQFHCKLAVSCDAWTMKHVLPLTSERRLNALLWLVAEAKQAATYKHYSASGEFFKRTGIMRLIGEGEPTWADAVGQLPNWRRFHLAKHEIIRHAEAVQIDTPATLRTVCADLISDLREIESGLVIDAPPISPFDIADIASVPHDELALRTAHGALVGRPSSQFPSKDLIDAVLDVAFSLPSSGPRPERPTESGTVSSAIAFLFKVVDWSDSQPVKGDLLFSIEEFAALVHLSPQTLRNAATKPNPSVSRPRPALKGTGSQPDKFAYSAYREWLIGQKPNCGTLLPIDAIEARRILDESVSSG